MHNVNKINFIPYKSLGDFYFGDAIDKIKFMMGKEKVKGEKGNKTLLLHYDLDRKNAEIIFRFDNDSLSRITIGNPYEILLENVDVTKKESIDKLLTEQKIIKRKTYTIFSNLGFVVSSFHNKRLEEIFMFNKDIQSKWENIHRPITSW